MQLRETFRHKHRASAIPSPHVQVVRDFTWSVIRAPWHRIRYPLGGTGVTQVNLRGLLHMRGDELQSSGLWGLRKLYKGGTCQVSTLQLCIASGDE